MKGNIMVVDDEDSILYAVKELLESEGFQVVTAGSGQECLNELEKGFRGVILMDIMMPEMNGWQTIQQMVDRGLIRGNIIAMLTALDQPGPDLEGLKEYVLDYITKPFDPKEIISMLEAYSEYV